MPGLWWTTQPVQQAVGHPLALAQHPDLSLWRQAPLWLPMLEAGLALEEMMVTAAAAVRVIMAAAAARIRLVQAAAAGQIPEARQAAGLQRQDHTLPAVMVMLAKAEVAVRAAPAAEAPPQAINLAAAAAMVVVAEIYMGVVVEVMELMALYHPVEVLAPLLEQTTGRPPPPFLLLQVRFKAITMAAMPGSSS